MKTIFTKRISAALITALALTTMVVKAQTTLSATDGATVSTTNSTTADTKAEVKTEAKEKKDGKSELTAPVKAAEDTSWKPQRRVWGYTFGDFYYAAHSDAGNRGPESNYNGVPTYRNAFQFRRIYLGYDYEITKKFKAQLLLASEPTANTGAATGTSIQNGDNLVDGKMAFWIKNMNLRVRDIWNGTDFVIGEMSTPGFALNEPGTNAPTSLSEATWAYRSIEKTVADFHKDNSYDVGAALQGTFDPKTKNFGYVLMVGNNSQASLLSAANANTGFYKIVYGDLWAKFFNQKLYVDIYTDFVRTAPATYLVPGQSHSMFKIFAAYNTKPITLGAEFYSQTFANGVTNKSTTTVQDAKSTGFSIWARGAIVKNLNYFARFDTYNPLTDFNSSDNYTINTTYSSYNPNYKEKFYTAGIDFNPTKNVHFEPNVWLTDYTDQRTSTTTGYVVPDHTLVYRLTFFFTFGK